MSDVATAIGNGYDAEKYTAIATRMRASMNDQLWDPTAGACGDGVGSTHAAMPSTVYALAFGVTDESNAKAGSDYVVSRGLACSVYCSNFVLQALGDAGRIDAAVALMSGDGQRSWKRMIALGAGGPMEA